MANKTIWCLKQHAEEDAKKYMPGWWERDDALRVWRNRAGGWHSMGDNTIIYVSVECEGDDDDYWKQVTPDQWKIIRTLAKDRMIDPTATSGWVTPSGEWFPCGWHHHDRFARFFFGKPVADLERTHARVKGEMWMIEGGLVTTAMSQRLKRMGFVDADGELYHHRHLETEDDG